MKIFKQSCVCIIGVLLLSSCSGEKFSVDQATQHGDVVNIHGRINNLEKFTVYLKNVENHVDSQIRITQLTIEGDPIHYDLAYKNGKLSYTYDNSADKFGSKNIMKTECSGIVHERLEHGIAYKLEGCKETEVGDSFSFVVPVINGGM